MPMRLPTRLHMPTKGRATRPRRVLGRHNIFMKRFASSAKEVRIHPRAMNSTSPRRASVGHKFGPNSSSRTPGSGRGQDSISESCHAGQDTDAGASELPRPANETEFSTGANKLMPSAAHVSSKMPSTKHIIRSLGRLRREEVAIGMAEGCEAQGRSGIPHSRVRAVLALFVAPSGATRGAYNDEHVEPRSEETGDVVKPGYSYRSDRGS
ncbi:hypothetical protein C8R47DRAFT_1158367 [Mycena vitilis]|nr:hypothetical protein C8R47DRAFT_1166553 [Mycena vitilis]KAJ6462349.1 hypothetical protein C8R47DRAFT_1158367 [Mycena vitilis]